MKWLTPLFSLLLIPAHCLGLGQGTADIPEQLKLKQVLQIARLTLLVLPTVYAWIFRNKEQLD